MSQRRHPPAASPNGCLRIRTRARSRTKARTIRWISARLDVVWYDDTKQILRLKDDATRKEYELGMATMLRYAHSTALQPRSYKIELESTASVADIAAFYKETLIRNGFTIVSETKSQAITYALEARPTACTRYNWTSSSVRRTRVFV